MVLVSTADITYPLCEILLKSPDFALMNRKPWESERLMTIPLSTNPLSFFPPVSIRAAWPGSYRSHLFKPSFPSAGTSAVALERRAACFPRPTWPPAAAELRFPGRLPLTRDGKEAFRHAAYGESLGFPWLWHMGCGVPWSEPGYEEGAMFANDISCVIQFCECAFQT